MHPWRQPSVAVLLATCNSGSLIEPQLRSLRENRTPFTLHWLDDHSTDGTPELVRRLAEQLRLPHREWHCPARLGVPASFFELLESVAADAYLFCDHDDIWQPGKIDATIAALAARPQAPALCFSEPLIFAGNDPAGARPYFEVIGVSSEAAQALPRAFVLNPAVGNTVGLTSALRDIYLTHREIARAHAVMHDWWLYLIARACGVVTLMRDVPTSLYRQHARNVFGVGSRRRRRTPRRIWRDEQNLRRLIARQAEGFLLAAPTLGSAEALEVLLRSARWTSECHHRRSIARLLEQARHRALPLPLKRLGWSALVSLLSDA